MFRIIRSIAGMLLVAFALVTALAITTQSVSAQLPVLNPDFSFHIAWKKVITPGNYRTEYEYSSLITRTVYELLHSPTNGTAGVTVTLGTKVVTDTFQYHIIDQVKLKSHAELSPFLLTYFDNSCLPGTDFVLLRENNKVVLMVSNVTTETVRLKVQNHQFDPEYHELSAHSGAEFGLSSSADVTVYSDTTHQKVCAVLWFNFELIDNKPAILHSDVFTMLEGTTQTFYPLGNDENIREDFGGMVSSEGLPFEAETGSFWSWKVISPSVGIYTTTYWIYPSNSVTPLSSKIVLHVIPAEKPKPEIFLVADFFEAPEGANVYLYPFNNDIGFDWGDVESFHIIDTDTISMTWNDTGEIQIQNLPVGNFVFVYQVQVYSQIYLGKIHLVVKPKSTTDEVPTEQPQNHQLFLAQVGR